MAPNLYGVIYHACRQVSGRIRYLCQRREDKLMRRIAPLRRISPLSPTPFSPDIPTNLLCRFPFKFMFHYRTTDRFAVFIHMLLRLN
jgi:hypothetical protein